MVNTVVHTGKAGGIRRITRARILRQSRERTEWTSHQDTVRRRVIDIFCRDDLGRRLAGLHPTDQCPQQVVFCIGWYLRATQLAESIRAGSAGAVPHARRQEQPEERLLICQCVGVGLVLLPLMQSALDKQVVVDRHLWRDQGVRETMET